MSDLETELLEATVAYKRYLESGKHRRHREYKRCLDPEWGECYSLAGEADCLYFLGVDAVRPLRGMRERLRAAANAACADEVLRPAVDAIVCESSLLAAEADPTINRERALSVDPSTGAREPLAEYVRFSVLESLDRVLMRLPTHSVVAVTSRELVEDHSRAASETESTLTLSSGCSVAPSDPRGDREADASGATTNRTMPNTLPALTGVQVDVLTALKKASGGSMFTEDIVDGAGHCKSAVRRGLPGLAKHGLVRRPEGTERKGVSITERGLEWLRQRETEKQSDPPNAKQDASSGVSSESCTLHEMGRFGAK